MRGEVLTFDAAAGQGSIGGDDGARYQFAAGDVRSPNPLERGQRVDFVASDNRQAREIIALHPAVATSTPSRRAFDLGRVVQRTVTSIGQNAAGFFGAAVVLVGVPSTVSALGQGSMLTTPTASSFLYMAVGTVLYFIGLFLLQGMVVKAAVNGFNGKKTSFGDAFNVGVQMFLPLLGLAIVASIGMGVGFLLLVVPGVILSILWSVAAPAVVVEKRGVFESLQRSRDLTRGYRWPVFGLLVIYIVLAWIVGAAVGGLSLAVGGTFETSPNLLVNLISGPVVNVVSGVVGSAGVASLYFELRTAKEGAGPEDLAAVFD